jgi:hypothetical protein
MTDILWELEKGVFDRVEPAVSVPVYDNVPQNSAYPYVVYNGADSDQDDFLNGAMDNVSFSLNVWSQEGGKKGIQNIMGEIYNALHNESFSITGGTVVSIRVTRRRAVAEDPETMNGQISCLARIRH